MREVKFAVVEHDGTVSVVQHEWAQPATKADIDKEMARARKDAIGEQEEPPASKRTDSAQALDRTPEEIR